MKTGFVILNYNSWKLTKALAEKVSAFNNIDKVVVVDNVSTDDSYQYLAPLQSAKIEVILSDKNGGYSYGNNIGAQYCAKEGADILFISNPDVDVEEADIDKLLNTFETSDYAMLSGVEYDIEGKVSKDPFWTAMTFKDDLLDCFFIGRKILESKKLVPLDKKVPIQEVDILKGSFFGVRMSSFLEVGGFDDNVFLFCEERIIARKFSDAGMKIGVVTDAKYQHNHSASITKTYKAVASQIKLLYDSRLYYNKTYEKPGSFNMLVLKAAMKISLLEYRLRDAIKGAKHR